MPKPVAVPTEDISRQHEFIELVKEIYESRSDTSSPLAYVRTYGCQQNVSDSERLKGMLAEMGFGFTELPDTANVILFNTCAVREHAEDRVFGNVGALKSIKRNRPDTLIALCGCMVQQQHVEKRLRDSFPFVGMVFGTHALYRFPELLYKWLTGERRVYDTGGEGTIAEGLPVQRDGSFKAWLPIMYGCDNFCSYCVVPYVRGHERSRDPDIVINEARALVKAGYKEITLLGQNVNSYGRGSGFDMDFPRLLRKINGIPGDFLIRFMTSHPKDATPELFDTIAQCEKVERHFHLPFQSGSNRILKAMNRGYTREQYLELIQYARDTVPEISFTSDVIVGFPGETRTDFEETLALIRIVEFTSLFTFIFSPREGTPAASMPDPVSAEEKSEWFTEMTQLQEEIAAKRSAGMIGGIYRALIENVDGEYAEARLSGNIVVRIPAVDSSIASGLWADVRVTSARSWILTGNIIKIY